MARILHDVSPYMPAPTRQIAPTQSTNAHLAGEVDALNHVVNTAWNSPLVSAAQRAVEKIAHEAANANREAAKAQHDERKARYDAAKIGETEVPEFGTPATDPAMSLSDTSDDPANQGWEHGLSLSKPYTPEPSYVGKTGSELGLHGAEIATANKPMSATVANETMASAFAKPVDLQAAAARRLGIEPPPPVVAAPTPVVQPAGPSQSHPPQLRKDIARYKQALQSAQEWVVQQNHDGKVSTKKAQAAYNHLQRLKSDTAMPYMNMADNVVGDEEDAKYYQTHGQTFNAGMSNAIVQAYRAAPVAQPQSVVTPASPRLPIAPSPDTEPAEPQQLSRLNPFAPSLADIPTSEQPPAPETSEAPAKRTLGTITDAELQTLERKLTTRPDMADKLGQVKAEQAERARRGVQAQEEKDRPRTISEIWAMASQAHTPEQRAEVLKHLGNAQIPHASLTEQLNGAPEDKLLAQAHALFPSEPKKSQFELETERLDKEAKAERDRAAARYSDAHAGGQAAVDERNRGSANLRNAQAGDIADTLPYRQDKMLEGASLAHSQELYFDAKTKDIADTLQGRLDLWKGKVQAALTAARRPHSGGGAGGKPLTYQQTTAIMGGLQKQAQDEKKELRTSYEKDTAQMQRAYENAADEPEPGPPPKQPRLSLDAGEQVRQLVEFEREKDRYGKRVAAKAIRERLEPRLAELRTKLTQAEAEIDASIKEKQSPAQALNDAALANDERKLGVKHPVVTPVGDSGKKKPQLQTRPTPPEMKDAPNGASLNGPNGKKWVKYDNMLVLE